MSLSIDTSYTKKDVVTALEYVSDQLFEKYPMLDFTIQRNRDETNAIWFLIHDKNIFQTLEFQEFVLMDITRDYLWSKKIYNIIFIFAEKV